MIVVQAMEDLKRCNAYSVCFVFLCIHECFYVFCMYEYMRNIPQNSLMNVQCLINQNIISLMENFIKFFCELNELAKNQVKNFFFKYGYVMKKKCL